MRSREYRTGGAKGSARMILNLIDKGFLCGLVGSLGSLVGSLGSLIGSLGSLVGSLRGLIGSLGSLVGSLRFLRGSLGFLRLGGFRRCLFYSCPKIDPRLSWNTKSAM